MRAMICASGLALFAVGCVKHLDYDVAPFEAAPGKITQLAPKTGLYFVNAGRQFGSSGREGKSSDRKGDSDCEVLPGTGIVVAQGTPMGFERRADKVFAFVDNRELELDVPPDAFLKWHTQVRERTRFAKNMRIAGKVVAETTLVAGLVAGALVVNGWVGNDDHNCYDPNQKCWPKH